nr:unnamed protein product [Callosobruchus analis]
MNVKFGGLKEGALLTELHELDKIRKQKKIIDDYMWKNLGKNKRINSSPVINNKKEGTFLLHPKRLSDTETSESSSPKLNSSSSSTSIFERDKDRLDTNTKNLTYTNRNPFIYDIDLDIGDTCTAPLKKDNVANTKEENVNTLNKISPNNKNGPPPAPKIVITDDVFEKKCKSFVEKSLHVISDIRYQMQKGVSPPDGDEDITRRQLRVKEFSNSTLTNQKLLSAYQIVLNGLTAYHNHLPTSIGVCSSDKLKLLLKNLLELCDIHSRIKVDNHHDISDFINIIRQSAEFTIEKIEDHFFAISTESVAKSHTTKNSLPQPKRTKNTAGEGDKTKKNSLAARLSMYNTTSAFRKDAMWRKMTESVGQKKHRPPAEKAQDNMLRLPLSKSNIFAKKSSGILKKTPVMTPINEDNITTMVEMEQMRSSTDDNEVSVEDKDISQFFIRFFFSQRLKAYGAAETLRGQVSMYVCLTLL